LGMHPFLNRSTEPSTPYLLGLTNTIRSCFKSLSYTLNPSAGAGRETRTLMVSPPADFESAASTGSAIPAQK
jgi:hypothetical protein